MRLSIALLLATRVIAASAPYAAKAPLPKPKLFAPGVISTADFESHPAFTPDGKTLYFLKDAPNFSFWTIVVSRFERGTWQSPTVAPWSGRYRDADPFITADGQRFFFISDRPVDGNPREDLDIWMMQREGDSWGEPRHLDAPVNSGGNEWFPTIASDGTLYFGSDREGGLGRTDIYRCRFVEGKYLPAENLGESINSKFDEFEPMIAPDQSFLIFMASGRPDGKGSGDLYVSLFRDEKWQTARNLGEPINSRALEISPKLSPDGRWLFFTSSRGAFTGKPFDKQMTTDDLMRILRGPGNGLGDIYQIDFDALGIGKE